MKKKNYGIQEVRDKDGTIIKRFKTINSKKEAKSSVGLILTGFIEPDIEYFVQEFDKGEDKYLIISKVKPPQIPESNESLEAKKENNKVIKKQIKKVKIISPQQTINPVDFNVDEKETVGFIAPPNLITNLINLIALPFAKDVCEFGKIVLHFDKNRKEVWWSNKSNTEFFLVNFGHATYDYFAYCWGEGEIGLPAARLLDYLKRSKNANMLVFFADPKKGSYEIKQDGKKDFFTQPLEAISEINSHKPRIDYEKNQSENQLTLDDNYIPISKEEIAALKYGGIVDASELKTIVEKGEKFKMKTYPIDFSPNPAEVFVTFNDLNSPISGTEKRKIIFKDGTLVVPDIPISQVISQKLKAPAKVLRGDVTLRTSMKEKSPFYLLKSEKSDNPNGVMLAGILFAGKEKKPGINKKPGNRS